MIDTCENKNGGYKCDECAFSSSESSTCANPNIWEEPPRDSYFKGRDESLTDIEIISIESHIGVLK